jgi:hypothetical protein
MQLIVQVTGIALKPSIQGITHPKYVTDFGINQFQFKPECRKQTDAFTHMPSQKDPPK